MQAVASSFRGGLQLCRWRMHVLRAPVVTGGRAKTQYVASCPVPLLRPVLFGLASCPLLLRLTGQEAAGQIGAVPVGEAVADSNSQWIRFQVDRLIRAKPGAEVRAAASGSNIDWLLDRYLIDWWTHSQCGEKVAWSDESSEDEICPIPDHHENNKSKNRQIPPKSPLVSCLSVGLLTGRESAHNNFASITLAPPKFGTERSHPTPALG